MHPALVVAGLALLTKKSTSRVGAVQWDDPSADPHELVKLITTEPRVLMNPQMPPDILLTFARIYPQYVEENPIISLHSLEDPAFGPKIKSGLNTGWLTKGFEALPEMIQRTLAGLFAQRVLPLYQDAVGDDLMMNALQTVNQYIHGEITHAELQLMYEENIQDADALRGRLRKTKQEESSYWALLAAIYAGFPYEQKEALQNAATFARDAETESLEGAEKKAKNKEILLWQVDLVRRFYHQLQEQQQRHDEAYTSLKKQIEINAKRRAATAEEAKKAVAQAQAGAKQCAEIMAKDDTQHWPTWIGLGVLGVSAVLVIGPGALLVMEGASEAVAAASAAETIIATAEAADVGTVSVQAFIEGAEIEGSEGTEFLGNLIAKLQAHGLEVVDEAVEAVARVAR